MTSALFQPLRRGIVPVLLLAGLTVSSCSRDATEPSTPSIESTVPAVSPASGLSLALATQGRHSDRLLDIEGVVGTAVAVDARGKAEMRVFTRDASVRGLPATLDGTPVSVIVTGPIRSLVATANGPAASTASAAAADPTNRFSRPVPIGISTGNQRQCIAGTIGARVKRGTAFFSLSNNHVYALENSAPVGSNVLQPGQADANCSAGSNAQLGKLSKFVRIVFSETASNRVDAAIASVTSGNLRRTTPSDGYGSPRATTASAALNQTVRKYGRTTGYTSGKVVGLNATVKVTYSGGRIARFVGQIMIQGAGFSDSGDSGSLIVDGNRRPVGLLFAGGGDYTFANPIGQVLSALNVKIDGN
jgi:hypothetical protein